MRNIISQTQCGMVFKCSSCNKIHIEFNNFNLNLSELEYSNFIQYINEIDGNYWANINKKSIWQRKIRIPIASTTVCLMLHPDELSALRKLLVLPKYLIEKMLVEKLLESVCWN